MFDEDNSGALNFYEFMCIKNAAINTPEEKLSWIFIAFDQDGGGTIDVDEIRDTVVALFKMSGQEEDEEAIQECVDGIRSAVDADGDGEITLEEFVMNAMNSDFICELIEKDENGDKSEDIQLITET